MMPASVIYLFIYFLHHSVRACKIVISQALVPWSLTTDTDVYACPSVGQCIPSLLLVVVVLQLLE